MVLREKIYYTIEKKTRAPLGPQAKDRDVIVESSNLIG